jgi:hypothetical protein
LVPCPELMNVQGLTHLTFNPAKLTSWLWLLIKHTTVLWATYSIWSIGVQVQFCQSSWRYWIFFGFCWCSKNVGFYIYLSFHSLSHIYIYIYIYIFLWHLEVVYMLITPFPLMEVKCDALLILFMRCLPSFCLSSLSVASKIM